MNLDRLHRIAAGIAALTLIAGCAGGVPGFGASPPPPPPTAPAATAPAGAPADTRHVKGQGDSEGDITGRPAPNSRFTRLQIGMGMREVTDLLGPPTDQGTYGTGKSWIPLYFGSDRYRHELVYQGMGRLIFAGGSVTDYAEGHLIWIIHNAAEGGLR